MTHPLHTLIHDKRILVCVGSGGVGKTTLAASVAVQAALEGRRALVVTIDPARRLANSLGMESLGNVATRILPARFERAGLSPEGELHAMMLDVKRTSDDMIARHAPSREQAELIYRNRFYQTASTVLAGSQEYMAMEQLYELAHATDYDLIVLDTPPTAHALDFLDAPNRMLDVFGNDTLKWLATPALAAGRFGLKAAGFGGGYLVKQISKFTGIETLQALAEFLYAMRGMYDGFKERAGRVKALLGSEDTSFVLVTSPNALTLDEARYFYTVLRQNEMPVGTVVVNRVNPDWRAAAGDAGISVDGLTADFGADLAERLVQTVDEQATLAQADAEQVAALRAHLGADTVLRMVPVFREDVHDLAGLARMAEILFHRGGEVPAEALPQGLEPAETGS